MKIIMALKLTTSKKNRFEIVYRCDSLDKAKKWASENLLAENEFQNDENENENDEEPEL